MKDKPLRFFEVKRSKSVDLSTYKKNGVIHVDSNIYSWVSTCGYKNNIVSLLKNGTISEDTSGPDKTVCFMFELANNACCTNVLFEPTRERFFVTEHDIFRFETSVHAVTVDILKKYVTYLVNDEKPAGLVFIRNVTLGVPLLTTAFYNQDDDTVIAQRVVEPMVCTDEIYKKCIHLTNTGWERIIRHPGEEKQFIPLHDHEKRLLEAALFFGKNRED